jgi:hypothetical protein
LVAVRQLHVCLPVVQLDKKTLDLQNARVLEASQDFKLILKAFQVAVAPDVVLL